MIEKSRIGLGLLIFLISTTGCSNNKATLIASNALPAINKADSYARSELDCSYLTSYITSSKETNSESTFFEKKQAEYNILISGCDQQKNYSVVCLDKDDCNVIDRNGPAPETEE